MLLREIVTCKIHLPIQISVVNYQCYHSGPGHGCYLQDDLDGLTMNVPYVTTTDH